MPIDPRGSARRDARLAGRALLVMAVYALVAAVFCVAVPSLLNDHSTPAALLAAAIAAATLAAAFIALRSLRRRDGHSQGDEE